MTPNGIEIAGVRARLADPRSALTEVRDLARSLGGWVQLLDAGHVAGRDHLVSACEHARRAFHQGTNTTDSLEMEFLLYASGERQISKAIERIGVRPLTPFVAVAADGAGMEEVLARFRWSRDDGLIEATPAKLRALGFSPAEIAAAGEGARDLALERVARVDVVK